MSEQRSENLSIATFLVLLAGGLVAAFFLVQPLLPSIIFGAILALMSEPLYRFLLRRSWRKMWAAFVVTLFIFLLVTGPLAYFVGRAFGEAVAFSQSLSQNGGLSLDAIMAHLENSKLLHMIWGDPSDIDTRVNAQIQEAGRLVSGFLVAQAATLPGLLLRGIIALVTCFFFLTDGGRLSGWFADRIPLDGDVKQNLKESFKSTSVSVIWAQFAAAAAQAAFLLVGFLVLNVPNAFLAAGTAFMFAWVPLIATAPVWIAASIYLFLHGAYLKMALMIGFGIGAGILDNVVRPLVLRGRSRMHPVVSLIAVIGGVRLFGVLGIFFGPILAAMVISLLQVWPQVGGRWGFRFREGAIE